MKRADELEHQSAVDQLDEAMRLLRWLPGGAWAVYLAGTVPFLVAFLWFWSDMARNAFAPERLLGASALLALLFGAMKTAHARFCQHLLARLGGVSLPPLTAGALGRTFLTQTALHALGLPVFLGAMVVVLPSGWAVAWGQSASVYGDGRRGLRETWNGAWRGMLWRQGQNHAALGILGPVILLAGLNVMLIGATLPEFVKIVTGVDTLFTRNPMLFLNTTVLVSAAATTWLLVDPLLKAYYSLRVFHAESLATGADLLADWRRLVSRAAAVVLLMLTLVVPGRAAPPSGTASPGASLPAEELNERIEEVMHRSDYAWRLPREQVQEKSDNWFRRWIESFNRWLTSVQRTIERWMDALQRWLDGRRRDPELGPSATGMGWGSDVLLWGGGALVAAVATLLVLRYRRRASAAPSLARATVMAMPDLTDEATTPDQLPEDEWFALAASMRARGELRLALRAMFLGMLARLAREGWIVPHPGKSNRDYQRELARRGPAEEPLLRAVQDNVLLFEGAWYGEHAAEDALFSRFEHNLNTVIGHAR